MNCEFVTNYIYICYVIGILLDYAVGVVIGEAVVVGNNVSILHRWR